MRLSILLIFTLAIIIPASQKAPNDNDPSAAKIIALRAVQSFCITWEIDTLDSITDTNAVFEDRGPGSFKKAILQMKKAKPWGEKYGSLSVKEIIFFHKGDIASLQDRCKSNRKLAIKRDLWAPKALPANIGDGLGCFVIAKEIDDGKEVDTEVYIFVVKKVQEKHKIVYFDNS